MNYKGPIPDTTIKLNIKGEEKVYNQKILCVTSKTLTQDLRDLGVISNKTGYEILPPNMPENLFFTYLLGLSDGDACFSVIKKPRCIKQYLQYSLSSANRCFLESIKYRFENRGCIYQVKNSKCLQWSLGHHDSVKLGELFYSNPFQFCLQRKKNIWLQGLNRDIVAV